MPNDIIRVVLSPLNTKQAVQECLLCKPWVDIWKDLPTLNLDDLGFINNKKFEDFVIQVLTKRNDAAPIESLQLTKEDCSPDVVYQITQYAFKHYLEKLVLNIKYFSGFSFTCATLTSLSLYDRYPHPNHEFPESLHFPSLNNLYLRNIRFCTKNEAAPFSSFRKLRKLVLDHCVLGSNTNSLLIDNHDLNYFVLVVDDRSVPNLLVNTPKLDTFCLFVDTISRRIPKICWGDMVKSSVKRVGIHYAFPFQNYSLKALDFLQNLSNIRRLVINNIALMAFSKGCKSFVDPFLNNLEVLQIKLDKGFPVPKHVVEIITQNVQSVKIEHVPALQN